MAHRHYSLVRTQADKSPSLLLWITATTVMMLLSMAGFAAWKEWMPAPAGTSRYALPVSSGKRAKLTTAIDVAKLPAKGLARRKVRCGECGWIESVRETESHGEAIPLIAAGRPLAENRNRKPVRSVGREITVRLEDGSSRVTTDVNPAGWRIGERVIVIGGVD